MLEAAPAHLCTRCRTNLWDTELAAGRLACYRCEDFAVEQLRAIAAMFKRLDTTAALMKGRGAPAIGGGTREAPAPLRIAILTQTGPGGVVTLLQDDIEDSWRKELKRTDPRWGMGSKRHHSDIDGVISFLINNLLWACERYDEIAADLTTIASIHGTLTSLETGEPGPRKFAAYCGTDDCHGQMRITLWTPRATCPTCGTSYDKTGLAGLLTELDADPQASAA
jgi:hypothetical protein